MTTAARVWRALRPWLVASAVGLLADVVGLRTADAVLVGLVALVVALAVEALSPGREFVWPEPERAPEDGTRRDVSALSWSFVGRDGRVSEAAVRHLQDVTTRRLARHAVVLPGGLRDPGRAAPDDVHRARTLLGDRAWRTLAGPTGTLPSVRDITHCVEVLERLDPTPGAR